MYPDIYRYIARRIDHETAKDLTQQVCLSVVGRNPQNPRAYLYKVARSKIADEYRRRGRAAFPVEDVVSLSDAREEQWRESHRHNPVDEECEARDLVERAMAVLPLKQREVVRLHVFEELLLKEVAQRLGLSYCTVRELWRKARKRLREFYEK